MSDKAVINVVGPRHIFEMSIYLQMEGRRAEEMVARALKRALDYRPDDPESVVVFILGEITRNLGDEHTFIATGRMEGCYRNIIVDTGRQLVIYRSIYEGDRDRQLSYENFYAEMEGRLAAGVIEHC